MQNHEYCAGNAHGVFLNKELVELAKQLSVRRENPNGQPCH